MRGTVIQLGIAAAVLITAFVITVLALNATAYSPAGFVSTYVDALVRKDPTAALDLAGPPPTSSALDDLLAADIMPDLEIVDVTEMPTDGSRHVVAVDYVADGHPGHTEFEVEETGTILGFFTRWGFARSPLVRLDLEVLHTREFTANGVREVTPAEDAQSTYLAFTPGAITFDHESELLEASERTIVFGDPTHSVTVTLEAVANDTFTGLVQERADAFLDECAEQQVLYPVGCPFGQDIADRLAGAPHWSILSYPGVAVRPTTTFGEWTVPPGSGVARIDVDVRSIYDGSVTPFAAEVPYRVGYVVTLVGEDIVVTPRVG